MYFYPKTIYCRKKVMPWVNGAPSWMVGLNKRPIKYMKKKKGKEKKKESNKGLKMIFNHFLLHGDDFLSII